LKHIREVQHENDAFCPYPHCHFSTIRTGKGFEDRKEIGRHFNLMHSGRDVNGYGCALGSCGNTKYDRCAVLDLLEHLRTQHKIYSNWHFLQPVLEAIDHTFRLQHVPSDYYNKWIDCEICASHTLQTPVGNTTSTSTQFGMAPV
jgi:hypothetical protein